MSDIDVGRNSFRLGALSLTLTTISLFLNNGFSVMMGATELGWVFMLIVLVASGLVGAAALLERSWWPYMFYLSGLLYAPTAAGLSGADWVTWFGLPGGTGTFGSALPEVICLAIGAVIVAGYLLAWGAGRLETIGASLVGSGAYGPEVDAETRKAFARLSASTWSLAVAVVIIWAAGGALAGWTGEAASSSYLLVALAAGALIVLVLFWTVRERREGGAEASRAKKE